MMIRRSLFGFILAMVAGVAAAQQVPDLDYRPPLPRPAYATGQGPRVAIDEAHHNFHTAADRYRPFAELLRRDGYRVDGLGLPLSARPLSAIDVLVIANPLHERNTEDWSLPTPSAYTQDEIDALHAWVLAGGALFLIVDHMPFPGAAGELARAFGVEFSNGFAVAQPSERPGMLGFGPGTGLGESAVTRGRSADERVTEVVTFTGSAFKPPQEAVPVLAFGAGFVSLDPETAWRFSDSTPRTAIAGWCQGAVMAIGRGRLAVFGEAAMFTAQLAGPQRARIGMNAPEAPQNQRLLLNVMHWLTRAEGMPD